MSYASFATELRKWWSFDDGQMHTHSWHSREDFIEGRMRELIDTETKPLHSEIELLRKLAKEQGQEIAITRERDERLERALTKIATQDGMDCYAADPSKWPTQIAADALRGHQQQPKEK